MGWGNCGTDSNGRPIGYVFEATCDHEGCNKLINRGLSYACGGMHGKTEYSCEKYFCGEHRIHTVLSCNGDYVQVCEQCADELLKSGEMYLNEDEDVIMHVQEQ